MNMHKLNEQINAKLLEARRLLKKLEVALVRGGYVRDDIYNSRHHGGNGHRGVYIEWLNGHIRLVRKNRDQSENAEPWIYIPVTEMNEYGLLVVADNLEKFVDHLEDSTRHMRDALIKVTEKMKEFVDRITDDPQPTPSGDTCDNRHGGAPPA